MSDHHYTIDGRVPIRAERKRDQPTRRARGFVGQRWNFKFGRFFEQLFERFFYQFFQQFLEQLFKRLCLKLRFEFRHKLKFLRIHVELDFLWDIVRDDFFGWR